MLFGIGKWCSVLLSAGQGRSVLFNVFALVGGSSALLIAVICYVLVSAVHYCSLLFSAVKSCSVLCSSVHCFALFFSDVRYYAMLLSAV